MFNLIWNITKSRAITIMSKVNLNEILSKTKDFLVKTPVKITKDTLSPCLKKDRWQTYFPFSFFYGGGKFQPIYFFVSVFSSLGVWMLWVKIHAASIAVKKGSFEPDMLSTADLTVVLGFVSSLILLYNSNKNKSVGVAPADTKKSDGN